MLNDDAFKRIKRNGDENCMNENCTDCPYNINEYCIMFDDVLGFEDCVFKKESDD